MSDETPTGDDGQKAEPEGDPTPQGKAADTPAGDDGNAAADAAAREAEKWKKRARHNEDQLKALRQQVKQLVDPEKVASVEQQLSDTNTRLARAEAEAARFRVALEAGLPADLAARLVGNTEDEMRADADKLKALLGKQPKGASQAARASGPATSNDKPQDLNALLRAAAGRG